jgi:hypothetical protein
MSMSLLFRECAEDDPHSTDDQLPSFRYCTPPKSRHSSVLMSRQSEHLLSPLPLDLLSPLPLELIDRIQVKVFHQSDEFCPSRGLFSWQKGLIPGSRKGYYCCQNLAESSGAAGRIDDIREDLITIVGALGPLGLLDYETSAKVKKIILSHGKIFP